MCGEGIHFSHRATAFPVTPAALANSLGNLPFASSARFRAVPKFFMVSPLVLVANRHLFLFTPSIRTFCSHAKK